MTLRGRDEKELQNRISELGNSISSLKDKISQYETDPPRVLIEKIYLKANGWANGGLLLCISIILFEASKLSPQIEKFLSEIKPSNKQEKTEKIINLLANEGQAVSYTIAAYLILTAFLLMIAMDARGRSVDIINRSFAICFVIGLATFGIFYVWRSGSIS